MEKKWGLLKKKWLRVIGVTGIIMAAVILSIFTLPRDADAKRKNMLSKSETETVCTVALEAIKPMNVEKLDVLVGDIFNVVDTEGKLNAYSLGFMVGDKPYGYAIYDIEKSNIREFVFCDGVENMYKELEDKAEDISDVDEDELLDGIVYEGGIDYCTFDEDGDKVEFNEDSISLEEKNTEDNDIIVFENVSNSDYIAPCSMYEKTGYNMCDQNGLWDVADSNISWHVVPDCGLAMITNKYVNSYKKNYTWYDRTYGEYSYTGYACTNVAATSVLNWMGRCKGRPIDTYVDLWNKMHNTWDPITNSYEIQHQYEFLEDNYGNEMLDGNGNRIVKRNSEGQIEYEGHGIFFGWMADTLNNYYFPSIGCNIRANAYSYYNTVKDLQFSRFENHIGTTESGEAAPCIMQIDLDQLVVDNNGKTKNINFNHAVTVLSTLHNSSEKYIGIWNGWDFNDNNNGGNRGFDSSEFTEDYLLKNVDTLSSAYKAIRYISWTDLTKSNVKLNAIFFNNVQSANIKEVHTNYICSKRIDYSCVVPNGTKYVYFPTWDEAEGTSKAVWHQGTVEANNYAHVSCDLSSDKDTANYATHVYAMDANGNQLAAYGTVYNTLKNKISVTASNPNIDSLKISCNSLPTGTTSVSFRVYPENNSTLVKNITCQLSGKTIQTTLKYSDFNYTSGKYIITAQAFEKYGRELDSKQISINAPVRSITNVKISDISIHGYRVTCKVPVGTASVGFPTWTIANAQDDICGYSGKPDSNRNVEVWINTMNHNNEGGQYKTQIQAYDKNGIMINTTSVTTSIVGRSRIIISQITNGNNGDFKVNVLLPTGTDEVKYTVTVRSVGRYGKKEYIHSISNTNKNGSDTLEVNKKNFYNANGVYDIHIMAYDASGDLITYCDTSTTLK